MTINTWLKTYMQLYAMLEKENKARTRGSGDQFMVPDFSVQLFKHLAHLIDLAVLDIGSLQYSYGVLAASALYHFTSEEAIIQCVGLQMAQIKECVCWMTPYAMAIRDTGIECPKLQVTDDEDKGEIQFHTVDLTLLETAHQNVEKLMLEDKERSSTESSPVVCDSSVTNSSPGRSLSALLTPPRSSSKPSPISGGGDGFYSNNTEKISTSRSKGCKRRCEQSINWSTAANNTSNSNINTTAKSTMKRANM